MTSKPNYVGPELLRGALTRLDTWARTVPKQSSRHVWSILPPKAKGAKPGKPLQYEESDDFSFMDRFNLFGEDEPLFPYFDPFTFTWLPAGFPHSNLATYRKKTFARSWKACEWESNTLTLSPDYGEVFALRALTKAGMTQRIPALACAIWFFKRPNDEWPDTTGLASGIPESAQDLIDLFKEKFNFSNESAWADIFDDSDNVLPGVESFEAGLSSDQLSKNAISDVCRELAKPKIIGQGPVDINLDGGHFDQDGIAEELEAAQISFSSPTIRRILSALSHSHVRLIGPPGTGKSTLVKAVLDHLAPENHKFAVATPSWTSDDVIGGLAPDFDDATRLVFKPGMVLKAADAGTWVAIDEINRADIDNAFGELFGLLAGFDVDLPYGSNGSDIKIFAQKPEGGLASGQYGLPRDWRMIATMNSWDKVSLNRVSFAFSRRWCTVYISVPSEFEYIKIIDNFMAANHLSNRQFLVEALRRIFAETGDGSFNTLRSLGYEMGPGVAKSCILDIAALVSSGASETEALRLALEGFLLPQFEGAFSGHESIAACLSEALAMVGGDEQSAFELERVLSVFTGNEELAL